MGCRRRTSFGLSLLIFSHDPPQCGNENRQVILECTTPLTPTAASQNRPMNFPLALSDEVSLVHAGPASGSEVTKYTPTSVRSTRCNNVPSQQRKHYPPLHYIFI